MDFGDRNSQKHWDCSDLYYEPSDIEDYSSHYDSPENGYGQDFSESYSDYDRQSHYSDYEEDQCHAYSIPIANEAHKQPPEVQHEQRAFISCVRAKVFNRSPNLAQGKINWRWATIMFDNGSERSWIVDELAQALELPGELNPISVCTFNSGEISHLGRSRLVHASFKLSEGEFYPIKLQTTDNISCRNIRSIVLDKNLGSFKLEDSHLAPSKVKPDIIIGQDHHWKLMLGFEELPSGFHLVKTKIGDMIGGIGNVPQDSMEPLSVCSIFNPFEWEDIQVHGKRLTLGPFNQGSLEKTQNETQLTFNYIPKSSVLAPYLEKFMAKEVAKLDSQILALERKEKLLAKAHSKISDHSKEEKSLVTANPKVSELPETEKQSPSDNSICFESVKTFSVFEVVQPTSDPPLVQNIVDSSKIIANAEIRKTHSINNLARSLRDKVTKITNVIRNPRDYKFKLKNGFSRNAPISKINVAQPEPKGIVLHNKD